MAVFVAGCVAGGSAVGWWQGAGQELPPPTAAADTSVELVLTGVAAHSRADGTQGVAADGALWLDGLLLHVGGRGTATMTRIHRPGRALRVGVPEIPVTLTPDEASQRIQIRVVPRDCALATIWTPSAQPFTVTWQGPDGTTSSEPGGAHNPSLELTLIQAMDAACDDPPPP